MHNKKHNQTAELADEHAKGLEVRVVKVDAIHLNAVRPSAKV